MDRNKVLVVNEKDEPLFEMDKMEAHEKGVLHRAFSIFIFNSKNEILIHQRAGDKYHGAYLWTNACCSHPQLNEDVKNSAIQRLQFEMGLQCSIHFLFSFIYKTVVENNLIEHEYDYVFIGYSDKDPEPNPTEVKAYKWLSINDLKIDIVNQPQLYTYWFKMALPKVLEKLKLF